MYRPAARLADIEPFHVVELLTRARQLESEGRDIIHMEVGEPDFPTPELITNAAVNAINSGKTKYTQALGLPELREAISAFYSERYGVSVPASRIAATNGASGALNLAFACLADPGRVTVTFCVLLTVDRRTSRSVPKPISSQRQSFFVSTGKRPPRVCLSPPRPIRPARC